MICITLGLASVKPKTYALSVGFRGRPEPLLGFATLVGRAQVLILANLYLLYIMLIFIRHFSISMVCSQKPEHKLYISIDWAKVDAGNYAVVDPIDNHAILYLSEKGYQVQVRVSMSQDSPLVVLARPGDSKQTPNISDSVNHSENSPIVNITKRNSSKWRKFLSWHLSSLVGLTGAKRRKASETSATVAISEEILRTLIPYWGLDLQFRLGGPLRPPRAFVSALRDMAEAMCRIYRYQGAQALIMKMKNALFMLNKALSGNRATDPWLLGNPVGLNRKGVPRLIPLLLRRRIMGGDPVALRIVTSILSAYKALEGSHKEQGLESIIGLQPDLDPETLADFKKFCDNEFWTKIVRSYLPKGSENRMLKPDFTIRSGAPTYIPMRAGPNSRFALFGAHLDAFAWTLEPVNWPLEWAKAVGDTRTPEIFRKVVQGLDAQLINKFLAEGDSSEEMIGIPVKTPELCISKLEVLPEPAGKVRIVAIVDYWTQRLMSPVHDWMMSILRCLPTDGTFDQEQSVVSFASTVELKGSSVDSIDLKSATDLIPIELYKILFSSIWGEHLTEIWISLLTDRWFRVPKSKLIRKDLRLSHIRYGRGQPMGALSSWASMALVHHALELFSAKRAGLDPELFVDYRILGDDNVTGNELVAKSYKLVAQQLCVPLSPAKTLSGKLFIFASQIYWKGINLSPLSLKEELGIKTSAQRMEMALRAIRRGWLDGALTLPRLLRLLLNSRDYSRCVKDWCRGKLGNIAQSALVSAFGTYSRQFLDLMGIQGSGFSTFLSVLRDRVQSIAGDRRPQGALLAKERALERLFVLATAELLQKELNRMIDRLRISGIRFRMWQEAIDDYGFLPRTFYDFKPYGKSPEQPGLLALPHPKHGLSTKGSKALLAYAPNAFGKVVKGKQTAKSASLDFFTPDQSRLDKALWEVINDAYAPLFGVATRDPILSDYDLVTSEEDYDDIEDATGVTFVDDESQVQGPGGWAVSVPDIIRTVTKARDVAEKVVSDLVSLPDEELGDPWLTLDDLATVLSRVKRVPDFSSITSFYTKKTEIDLLRPWIRKATLLDKVSRHLQESFLVKGPIDDSMPSVPLAPEAAYAALRDCREQGYKTNQGLLTGSTTASLIENNVG